jgi:hypothetical protein
MWRLWIAFFDRLRAAMFDAAAPPAAARAEAAAAV